jgi:hypothetical protein
MLFRLQCRNAIVQIPEINTDFIETIQTQSVVEIQGAENLWTKIFLRSCFPERLAS